MAAAMDLKVELDDNAVSGTKGGAAAAPPPATTYTARATLRFMSKEVML